MKRTSGSKIPLIAIGVLSITVAMAAETKLTRHTVDSGGIMKSTNGLVELSGTIGQPDASILTNGNTRLFGGFWFPVPIGDCNTDGMINLPDHGDSVPCIRGPNAGAQGTCACFDLDQDSDVDLYDAAEFQLHFQGS